MAKIAMVAAGVGAWFLAPWACMTLNGTIDSRARAACH